MKNEIQLPLGIMLIVGAVILAHGFSMPLNDELREKDESLEKLIEEGKEQLIEEYKNKIKILKKTFPIVISINFGVGGIGVALIGLSLKDLLF